MNIRRSVLALTTLVVIISVRTFSANQQSSAANASPQSFLGRWDLSDAKATSKRKVEVGTLVTPGRGPELITNGKFQDFKLHLEFNCGKASNSGVYLRGRYELQIEADPEPEAPSMRTGVIYGFIAPSPEQPRKAGEWQSYDITLVSRIVTVVHNGQTIIDK